MKKFGTMVAEARRAKEKPLTQAQLAQRASKLRRQRIAPSTISRIEKNAIPFGEDIGLAIIAALKVTEEEEELLKNALSDFLGTWKLPKKYRSGRQLDNIMTLKGISNVTLAEKLGKVHQMVQAWRAGVSLMSDDMLVKVKRTLEDFEVEPAYLDDLTRLHVYDVLTTMPRLTYLDKNQREKLAEMGAALIVSPTKGRH